MDAKLIDAFVMHRMKTGLSAGYEGFIRKEITELVEKLKKDLKERVDDVLTLGLEELMKKKDLAKVHAHACDLRRDVLAVFDTESQTKSPTYDQIRDAVNAGCRDCGVTIDGNVISAVDANLFAVAHIRHSILCQIAVLMNVPQPDDEKVYLVETTSAKVTDAYRKMLLSKVHDAIDLACCRTGWSQCTRQGGCKCSTIQCKVASLRRVILDEISRAFDNDKVEETPVHESKVNETPVHESKVDEAPVPNSPAEDAVSIWQRIWPLMQSKESATNLVAHRQEETINFMLRVNGKPNGSLVSIGSVPAPPATLSTAETVDLALSWWRQAWPLLTENQSSVGLSVKHKCDDNFEVNVAFGGNNLNATYVPLASKKDGL